MQVSNPHCLAIEPHKRINTNLDQYFITGTFETLYLASLTFTRPQPLLYMSTTKRSSVCMYCDCRLSSWGWFVRATSVSVRSEMLCQADQAVFLPHPRKCDTVSQPVMAWKSGKARHVDGPNWAERVWIGMSRIFFPLPRHTHNSDRPSDANQRRARMTTSLSTVCTKAIWWPWLAASARWRRILVSASVWLHGWRPGISCCLLEITLYR